MSTNMTVRIAPELRERLERLAEATQRSTSSLITEALTKFIDLNEWQAREIKQATNEANKGQFASDEAVKTVFGKWGAELAQHGVPDFEFVPPRARGLFRPAGFDMRPNPAFGIWADKDIKELTSRRPRIKPK